VAEQEAVDDQGEKEETTVELGENQILKGVRVNMPDIIYFEEEINKLYGLKNRVMNKKSNNDI